jgi:hypothetical protein
MKRSCAKTFSILFFFLSTSLFAQRENVFTDTIPFANPIKTRNFSIRHYNRLLNEKKISVLYSLKDTNVFLVRHQLDTLSNLGILVRNGKKITLYEALGGRKNLSDTGWVECNAKPGKELRLRWTSYESRNHEFGTYSGTRSGIEIWDMSSFRKILEMETAVCGQGWNMCSGKSHSGCGTNIRTEFRMDTLIFEDFYTYSHTEKRIVSDDENGKHHAYQIEVEVRSATIIRYVYVYSENGLLKKSRTVKQFRDE